MRRVLVTGGAGYIGSHTSKALAKAGYEPVVYDNFSMGHKWAVLGWPLVEGDLSETIRLRDVFTDFRIEAVIHFAAHAYVGESVEHPKKYYRNNVVNTLHLLDAMCDCGVRHIVFSSSCATYGSPRVVPIREDHPQCPINPYGESKLFAERAVASYSRAYGLKHVVLRYFNAAGADLDGELGESHDPETHLVPLALTAALGHGPPLRAFGTDYPTPDGTAVRDYVHVADLADAHLASLRYLEEGGDSTSVNLGSGTGVSVRDVLRAAERVSGLSIPVIDAPRRTGDPPILVASRDFARSVLAWTPKSSDLETILETAWDWHKNHAP